MNYIISSLFTTCIDPQRNTKWKPVIETIKNWYLSGKENVCQYNSNSQLIIFYDVLDNDILEYYFTLDYITLIKVPNCDNYSPHDYRWFVYKSFLEDNYNEVENIFFTDIQDVLIQSNPFLNIDNNVLYCGDEWMHPWENGWAYPKKDYYVHNLPTFLETYINNKNKIFLNAGILGGNKDIVLKFLDKICYYINITLDKPYNTTDMIIFNYIIYKYFPNKKHGEPVNSKFKEYEESRKDVWFAHK